MKVIKQNILLNNRKKQRLDIKNLHDFNKALKVAGYDLSNLEENISKEKISEIFNVDKTIVDKIYLAINDDKITYRAENINGFIDYIEKIHIFETKHNKLCEEISKINELHIDRIEYERAPLYQENVEEILRIIDNIKDKISCKMTQEEILKIDKLEREIDKQYIYSKDIELLKKMIDFRKQSIDEKYDLDTRVKTISINIPKVLTDKYVPAKLGTIEYYQHLTSNIPRMQRLIDNVYKYIVILDKENRICAINQSETLQDTINIAYATFNNKQFKAVSGSNDIEGYCAALDMDKQEFESCKVNKLGKLGIGYNRINDSEKKIFEEINKQIIDGVIEDKGDLTLYSKWQPCSSCYYVISQFSKKYPNINITVKYNKTYGEGSS